MSAIATASSLRPVLLEPKGAVRMTCCLIVADTFALVASTGIGFLCKMALVGNVGVFSYLRLWPFALGFPAVYALVGLYPGIALSPTEELRRIATTSSILYLVLAAATVSFRGGEHYVTWMLFLVITVSVIMVPLVRTLVRQSLSREAWWGYPAVVFGSGESARSIVRVLRDEPDLGLKACIVVDNLSRESSMDGVPVVRDLSSVPQHLLNGYAAYAVVPVKGGIHQSMLSSLEKLGGSFSRVLLIPEYAGYTGMTISPKGIGLLVGLEIPKTALNVTKRWEKRVLDLLLILPGALAALPLCALIALWIKLDSPGPVLYGQRRIGYGGRHFMAWKFRSMRVDAEQVLEHYLEHDIALRIEWENTHKLRNDPRVSRSGSFLRRTSLDELPQLWNVLMGEMSLVGPRPIVDAEIDRYGEHFELYKKVQGGLTGLWQVSGRSDTSYQQRVMLDLYYARNWSVWLDLCIILRTVGVVLFSNGAY